MTELTYVKQGHDLIRKTRIQLLLDPAACFYSTLATRLDPVARPGITTASTDGNRIYYNPEWFAGLTGRQRLGVIVHETLHVALGHMFRRGTRNLKRFNIAADLAINPIVKDGGFDLPDGCLKPSQFGFPQGLSAEAYYDLLASQDRPDPEPQDGEPQDCDGGEPGGTDGGGKGKGKYTEKIPSDIDDDQDGDQEAQGSPSADEADEDGSGQTPGTEPGDDDEGDDQGAQPDDEPATEDDVECPDPGGCGGIIDGAAEEQAAIEENVREAATVAKGRGSLPSAIGRLIDDAQLAKVSWRDVLRRFIQEAAKSDYSWSSPNRRHIASGLYLPSLKSEDLGHIVVAVDTSWSMSKSQVEQALAEVNDILNSGFEMRLTIVWHTSVIVDITEWLPGDPDIKMSKARGGGTSHKPVFEWIELNVPDAKAIVCLTDCYTSYPNTAPETPVLWGGIGRSQYMEPPFGEVVDID